MTPDVRPDASSRFSADAADLTLDGVPAPAAAPLLAPSTAGHRQRVLVADDNRDAADLLGMLLEHLGHEVQVAYDGEAALRVAREFRPTIAILDIGMPRRDGYDVARTLRGEDWAQGLVLVAGTGWGDPQARQRAAEVGFDRHLTKPIDLRALELVMAGMPPAPPCEAA